MDISKNISATVGYSDQKSDLELKAKFLPQFKKETWFRFSENRATLAAAYAEIDADKQGDYTRKLDKSEVLEFIEELLDIEPTRVPEMGVRCYEHDYPHEIPMQVRQLLYFLGYYVAFGEGEHTGRYYLYLIHISEAGTFLSSWESYRLALYCKLDLGYVTEPDYLKPEEEDGE